jgi:hypothetical protein
MWNKEEQALPEIQKTHVDRDDRYEYDQQYRKKRFILYDVSTWIIVGQEEKMYMKTQHVLFTNVIDSLHSSWINCFVEFNSGT